MNKTIYIAIILSITLAAIAAIFTLPPIPQDMNYHNFADKRPFLGIPNFGDVVGNVPFAVFGVMGLAFLYNKKNIMVMPGERTLWRVFFFGAALVGLGSSYYHLKPTNATLVWDRLPMTLAFMSFFALVVQERIHPKAGLFLAPLLFFVGIGSVAYWAYTDDLRAYALVQFLPLVLVPLMLWFFPARYTGLKYLGMVVAWYLLAKVLEHFDQEIFTVLDGMVSGHTLKHLAAAMSVYTMLLYVKRRSVV